MTTVAYSPVNIQAAAQSVPQSRPGSGKSLCWYNT